MSAEAHSEKKRLTHTDEQAGTGNTSKSISEGKRKILAELEKRKMSDEAETKKLKQRKQRYVKKTKQLLDKNTPKKEIQILPDVDKSRTMLRRVIDEEEAFLLRKGRNRLERETSKIKQDINEKIGVASEKDRPNMVALAKRFCGRAADGDIPEMVRKTLTTQEMNDLRMVYDMFDVKGRGYITADDLQRLASMIGFRAKKNVYDEMIGEITGGHSSQITFINLLEFIVKVQKDGPDPLDHIIQGFNLLDTDDKGYITFDDLRRAADDTEAGMSNVMLREMMQEADQRGDGKVLLPDFIKIMLMTDTFGTVDMGDLG